MTNSYLNYRDTITKTIDAVDTLKWDLTSDSFGLWAARSRIADLKATTASYCHGFRLNEGPILECLADLKATSKDGMRDKCVTVGQRLQALRDTLDVMNGQKWADKQAEADKAEELAATEGTEQAFINRCVAVLDGAGMGEHNVYIHWFRIAYGCWVDAEEVINAGGLADYLGSLGMAPEDVAELLTRDWDCQDAEGLAFRCLHNYGSFDWMALEELLTVECAPEVLVAGLDCGITPEEIESRYMGTWDCAEDMAAELWEEWGMMEGVPQAVRPYINWQAIARDMELNGEFVKSGDHYFRSC